MEFCPKCGSLLVPDEIEGKKVLLCRTCETTSSIEGAREKYILSEKMKEKTNVVLVKEEIVPYPKAKALCKKCGNTEAYYYSVQTRGGDESETVYMTCTKCKNVWKVTS
jgi:DNA-directed RNA polymerase subunit M